MLGDKGKHARSAIGMAALPLGAAVHKGGRGRRVGGEFDQLVLVAIGDDEQIHDAAADKGGGGMGEDRLAGERGEEAAPQVQREERVRVGHEEPAAGRVEREIAQETSRATSLAATVTRSATWSTSSNWR